MSSLVGVILAAGLGTRAYPHTAAIPKSLLEVDGKPLLQYNLEILRDQIGVHEVLIVVGHLGHMIERAFGDGARLGLTLRYIHNEDLSLGLAHSARLAGREVVKQDRNCVIILGDECYVDSHHERIREVDLEDAIGACCVVPTDLPRLIRRNYSVEVEGRRVVRIVEKPKVCPNDLLGLGTYIATPRVFERLEQAFAAGPPAPGWMEFLGGLVRAGEKLVAVELTGDYANVNSRDELNRANLLVRNRHFAQKSVSVVVVVDHVLRPVEEDLARFARSELVDEVVIVTEQATPSLTNLCRHPKLKLHALEEGSPSFGDMTRFGLDHATGDILVLTQCDDSFAPDDLPKLLTYVRDADLVVGTRTQRQMIEQGSNMRGAVRLAHVLLAKLTEVIWWGYGPRLTDLGCVFRAIWRSTYRLVRDQLTTHGQEIYPEMVLEVLRARRRVIEIPVNYYNRDPRHEAVTSPHQTPATFLRILWLLVTRRVRQIVRT